MKRQIPVLVVAVLGLLIAGQNLTAASHSGAASRVVKISKSINGAGTTDVSAKMAAFFKSVPDGSTVELKRGAKYLMNKTLLLDGRHGLTIEGNGALFFVRSKGDLKRANVRIQNSSDIVVHNLVLKGANPHGGTYDDSHQLAYEGQHGFSLLTDTNISLLNNTVTDVYGDFVYIGRTNPHTPWTNKVIIRNNHFSRNGRQGITIIDARNVLVQWNTITDITRATFDFEGGSPGGGVEGVMIVQNEIGVGRLVLVAAQSINPVNHVLIGANHVHGQNLQMWIENDKPGNRIGWMIVGNTSDMISGNPHRAAMRIDHVNQLDLRDNVQRFQVGRGMVLANIENSCNYSFGGNQIPGAIATTRVAGHC